MNTTGNNMQELALNYLAHLDGQGIPLYCNGTKLPHSKAIGLCDADLFSAAISSAINAEKAAKR